MNPRREIELMMDFLRAGAESQSTPRGRRRYGIRLRFASPWPFSCAHSIVVGFFHYGPNLVFSRFGLRAPAPSIRYSLR